MSKELEEALPHHNSMDITRPGDPSEKSFGEKMKKHFTQEVSTDHADILMLFCCLITGFLDSTLYNGMVDMQRLQDRDSD